MALGVCFCLLLPVRPVRGLPPFPRLVGGGFVGSACSVVSVSCRLPSAVASSIRSRLLAFVLRGSSRVLWLHYLAIFRPFAGLTLVVIRGVPASRLLSACLPSRLSPRLASDPSDLLQVLTPPPLANAVAV